MVNSTLPATIVVEIAELICTEAAFTWLTISYAPKRNKLVNYYLFCFSLKANVFKLRYKLNLIHGRSV